MKLITNMCNDILCRYGMVYSVITQESKGAVYLIGIIHLDGELLLNSND